MSVHLADVSSFYSPFDSVFGLHHVSKEISGPKCAAILTTSRYGKHVLVIVGNVTIRGSATGPKTQNKQKIRQFREAAEPCDNCLEILHNKQCLIFYCIYSVDPLLLGVITPFVYTYC